MPPTDTVSILADGTTLGDHFVILRTLGQGGMGEVYLAENLILPDKKYAVKVLRREFSDNPKFVAMLRDEASKQSRLEHDNVVGIYDFFVWNEHYCLIQTYVEGRTLAQMIEAAPAGLALPVALPLMMGILSGLDYAHKLGILHCDVKPANVIVDKDGRPRLTDFGIAREIGATAREGALLGAGTVEYMSPEQVLTPREIDHRSDVFSCGVLFFETLCGRLPFVVESDSDGAPLPQLQRDAPDVRSLRADVPEALARIVATALQRDPSRRFQGCADFRQAIEDYLKRERWRKTWLPAIAATTVVAVIGAVGLSQWRANVEQQVTSRGLKTAASSLNLLCREWIDYQIKAPFIEKARAAGVAEANIRQYQRKLDEMEQNMDSYTTSYADAMQQLKSADLNSIAVAIRTQVSSGDLLPETGNWISTDHAALHQGGSAPERTQLLRRCPPPVGTRSGADTTVVPLSRQ